MNHQNIQPILHKIEPDRQGARRHYGVHPYFTRRPYNVVRDYIAHYSSPGEKVLDPFGGSGVTAIESFLLSRTGIQNDINPLANFISDGLYLLSKLEPNDIQSAFVQIIESISPKITSLLSLDEKELESNWESYLQSFSFPPNIILPKNSDVVSYYDLFTKSQLVSLALMKSEIEKINNPELEHVVLLAWSATLSKLNKTFLSAEGRKESRGGSSIFSIYRYKVADKIVELNPLEIFVQRAKNILKAQKEIIIEKEINTQKFDLEGKYISTSVNATELNKNFYQEIDYVFTDPPYGGHIAYLDLSTLWNLWLGKIPDKSVYEKELIVGGETKHTEEFYIENLMKSITAISELLKDNRCFSIVFQHKNVKYFEAILEASFESNSKLIASVPQGTGTIWSMHKKKGKHSVIAGEFILTFQKNKKRPRPTKQLNKTFDELVSDYLSDKKEAVLINEEEVFNDLVVLCWQQNLINELSYSALDIPQKLSGLGFSYDSQNHSWTKNQSEIQMQLF
jgi:DNA modification methylase